MALPIQVTQGNSHRTALGASALSWQKSTTSSWMLRKKKWGGGVNLAIPLGDSSVPQYYVSKATHWRNTASLLQTPLKGSGLVIVMPSIWWVLIGRLSMRSLVALLIDFMNIFFQQFQVWNLFVIPLQWEMIIPMYRESVHSQCEQLSGWWHYPTAAPTMWSLDPSLCCGGYPHLRS